MVQCDNPLTTWPRVTLSILLPTEDIQRSAQKCTGVGCPTTSFPSFYASLYLTRVGEAGSSGSDTLLAWQISTSPPNNVAGTEHLLCKTNPCLSVCTHKLFIPSERLPFICVSSSTFLPLYQRSLFHAWEEPVPL